MRMLKKPARNRPSNPGDLRANGTGIDLRSGSRFVVASDGDCTVFLQE
jgi:hypothetical protein